MIRSTLLLFAALAGGALAGPALADISEPGEPAVWRPADGDVIAFDVLRQGNPFGTHTVRFSRTAEGELGVDVDVSLKAGLGPITLFRYELDAKETWRDGKLVGLEGEVVEDGKKERVRAERAGDRLIVRGDAFSGEIDGQMLPASHWNVDQVRASQLLSSDYGMLIDVQVQDLGRETIEAGGQMVEANKYLLDSDIDVTLWYDDQGRWVKLAFEARGQEIDYVLRELY